MLGLSLLLGVLVALGLLAWRRRTRARAWGKLGAPKGGDWRQAVRPAPPRLPEPKGAGSAVPEPDPPDPVRSWTGWPAPQASPVLVLDLGEHRRPGRAPDQPGTRGRLIAHVRDTAGGPLRLFSLLASGAAAQHPTLVLTLVDGEGVDLDMITDLFAALVSLSGDASLSEVHTSGVGVQILFKRRAILGRFPMFWLDRAEPIPGMDLPDDAIAVTMLTAAEAEVALWLSPLRVLHRLGEAARWFPWPPWNDPRREDAGALDRGASALGSVPMLRLPSSHLALEAPEVGPGARGVGLAGTLVLGLHPQDQAAFAVNPPSRREAVALVVARHPYADGALVWRPGQGQAEAIGPASGRARVVAGTFLALGRAGADPPVARVLEDGFLALLDDRDFGLVCAALEAGRRHAVPITPSLTLEIVPLQLVVTDESGLRLADPRGVATWRAGLRSVRFTGAPPPIAAPGEVKLARIALLSPDPELRARLGSDQLVELIQDIERRVADACAALGPRPAALVRLRVEVQPDGHLELQLAPSPLPRRVSDTLTRAARGARAPVGEAGEAAFELTFSVGALGAVAEA